MLYNISWNLEFVLVAKCAEHDICQNFCVPLRKPELYFELILIGNLNKLETP